MPAGMRVKGRLCVFGRLEPAAAAELSCRDLAALAALLGDNTFFHGPAPGTLDCAVFGHLAQFLYIDMDFPQKKYLKENATNLVNFVDRMRLQVWPDWSEMCDES